MRWALDVAGANSNDLIPHRLNVIEWALCKFFDQYSWRGPPCELPTQQIGRVFCCSSTVRHNRTPVLPTPTTGFRNTGRPISAAALFTSAALAAKR